MTACPRATKTEGWRVRNVNGVSVYAIDYTRETAEAVVGTSSDEWLLPLSVVRSFLAKIQQVTPLRRWTVDNPYAEQQMSVVVVSSANNERVFEHQEETKSVRNVRVSPTSVLAFRSRTPPSETSLNVVLFATHFVDRRTEQTFYEFSVVGLWPCVYARREQLLLGRVVFNRRFDATTVSDRQLLACCAMPRIRILPFGGTTPGVSHEKLLSFFIRWHVARKRNSRSLPGDSAKTSFFDEVVGVLDTNEELEQHLVGRTVRFFPEKSAADELFADPSCFRQISQFWCENKIQREHRGWMARQFGDACAFAVERLVIPRGDTARRVFVDDCVVPALNRFLPGAGARRAESTVSVDFFAVASEASGFDLPAVSKKHRPLVRDGECAVTMERGRFVMPLSIACHALPVLLTTVLERLVDEQLPSIFGSVSSKRWDFEVNAMPILGGDTYRNVRSTRFDDFPIGCREMRKFGAHANAASTSTRDALVPASLCDYNLPIENGMGEQQAASTELKRSGASIPMKNSSASINVSSESLHDMCSNVALSDIEDIGSIVQENPVVNLIKRMALPMCMREMALVYTRGNKSYLSYHDRKKFLLTLFSLKIPALGRSEIIDFMLCNSKSAGMYATHKREFEGLANWAEKTLAEQTEKMVKEGLDRELATRNATCTGGCKNCASKDKCPYTRTAKAVEGAEDELRRRIVAANESLRGDDAAVDRIVATTKTTRSETAGCMQEFIETRRKLGIETALNQETALFTHPKHYVYASAACIEPKQSAQQNEPNE